MVLKVVKKQWVYITKDDWCNMQEEFIKEKVNSLSLVPLTTLNKFRCIGIYKFIPRSSGLRPLFIAKYINICLINTPSVMFSYVLQININTINKTF